MKRCGFAVPLCVLVVCVVLTQAAPATPSSSSSSLTTTTTDPPTWDQNYYTGGSDNDLPQGTQAPKTRDNINNAIPALAAEPSLSTLSYDTTSPSSTTSPPQLSSSVKQEQGSISSSSKSVSVPKTKVDGSGTSSTSDIPGQSKNGPEDKSELPRNTEDIFKNQSEISGKFSGEIKTIEDKPSQKIGGARETSRELEKLARLRNKQLKFSETIGNDGSVDRTNDQKIDTSALIHKVRGSKPAEIKAKDLKSRGSKTDVGGVDKTLILGAKDGGESGSRPETADDNGGRVSGEDELGNIEENRFGKIIQGSDPQIKSAAVVGENGSEDSATESDAKVGDAGGEANIRLQKRLPQESVPNNLRAVPGPGNDGGDDSYSGDRGQDENDAVRSETDDIGARAGGGRENDNLDLGAMDWDSNAEAVEEVEAKGTLIPDLFLYLESGEDDTLELSWEFDDCGLDLDLAGFEVSYRMNEKEEQHAIMVGPAEKSYSLHNLHLDQHYNICVKAWSKNDTIIKESCQDWTQNSLKIVIGILAGTIFLVPMLIVLLCILLKDRKIRKKHAALFVSIKKGGPKCPDSEALMPKSPPISGEDNVKVPAHHRHHHHHDNSNAAGSGDASASLFRGANVRTSDRTNNKGLTAADASKTKPYDASIEGIPLVASSSSSSREMTTSSEEDTKNDTSASTSTKDTDDTVDTVDRETDLDDAKSCESEYDNCQASNERREPAMDGNPQYSGPAGLRAQHHSVSEGVTLEAPAPSKPRDVYEVVDGYGIDAGAPCQLSVIADGKHTGGETTNRTCYVTASLDNSPGKKQATDEVVVHL